MRRPYLLTPVLLLATMACTRGHSDVTGAGGTGGRSPGGSGANLGGAGMGGRSPGGPDAGAQPRAGVFPNADSDSAYIYDQNEIRTYELRLGEEDLARINADPSAEEYAEGSLWFEGVEHGPVGIRYKGSIGAFLNCTEGASWYMPSGAKTCNKLSMKVKFNWLDPDGRFYGMKRIQFHSMNNDLTLLRERLGYSLFNDMGVHAPRVVHARLLINGENAGLFALVEQIDGMFTRRHFPDGGEGNLYKEVWPVHADPEAYRSALETNEDENPSFDKIVGFRNAIDGAAEAELPTAIDQWMDREYMARYIAVDRAIENDDGIFHWYCVPGGFAPNGLSTFFLGNECFNHNFFWYEATDSDRLWLIPWDLDITWQAGIGITALNRSWNDTSTTCSDTGPGFPGQMDAQCDKLTRGWGMMHVEFKAAVAELLAGPLSVEAVDAKLDAWVEQLRPIVDAGLVLDEAGLSTADWESAVALWRLRIATMRTVAAGWL